MSELIAALINAPSSRPAHNGVDSAMLRPASIVLFLIAFLGPAPAQAQSELAASATPPDSSDTLPAPTVPTESEPGEDASRWKEAASTVEDHVDDYVGTTADDLYKQESEVYRTPPPIRYNRVEGFVFGLRRAPLTLGSGETARVVGQVAYATQLKDVRYSAGVETQLYAAQGTGLKVGVRYQKQTLSQDRWKTSYLENSLASAGFRLDFFDYYEAEGLTVYAVQDLPLSLRLTTGFRSQEHRPLQVQTNWSLFGDGSFRANPAIDAGRMQVFFASVTGGHIHDRDDLPSGRAVRLAATIADGAGGDFSFYRYEADGRLFLPVTPDTRLGLRLRGGYATSQAPLQSQFTLGGIGSLPGYDQNRFRGTRMVLGNAEYIIDGATVFDDVLDDLFLVGFADAGWVGGPGERPQLDDVLPSAGFGIGLDEREVRLDLSWPLREVPGTGSSPSLRLRVTPNF